MAQLKDLTVSGYTSLGQATGVTQLGSDSSNALATTEFVKNAFVNNDALRYKGTIIPIWDAIENNGNGGTLTPAGTPGETYRVTANGVINGQFVTQGSLLICREAAVAATQDTFSSAPSSATEEYLSEHPIYIRYTRQPNTGRKGGFDTTYYYEQILDNGHPYFYVDATPASLTENTAQCFYVQVADGTTVTRKYIAYNSSTFKTPDQLTVSELNTFTPIYMDLTATNYSASRTGTSNNFYIKGSDTLVSTRFDIVRDNWDYITSDLEGLLYKLEGGFQDGHALMAYGTQGIVAASPYILDEACSHPVANGLYRQPTGALMSMGIFYDMSLEIEDIRDDLTYLEGLIQELNKNTSIITNDLSYEFVEAGAGLKIGDSFVNNMEYIGQFEFTDTAEFNAAAVNTGKTFATSNFYTATLDANGIPTSYTAASTYNPDASYYQPKYWTGAAGSETPCTSGTAVEGTIYYERNVKTVYVSKYPSFHLSNVNTVEDNLIELKRMINGVNNGIDLVTDTNSFYLDFDRTTPANSTGRTVSGCVSALETLTGIASNTTLLTAIQSFNLTTSNLTDNINQINTVLSRGKYDQNNGDIRTIIDNNGGLVAIAKNYIDKLPLFNWFTPSNGNQTLVATSPTTNSFGWYLGPEGFHILNKNQTTITNPLLTVTAAKAEYIVPIQLKSTYTGSTDVTWKMYIRSNGNLSFGLVAT